MIISTATNCYAEIKAFQASLFLLPDDVFFRKGTEFFAESRDHAGLDWYALKPLLSRNRAVFLAFSICNSETAFHKAAAEGGQGLWLSMIDAFHRIDAAMRFTGTPIKSGRVV